MKRLDRVSIILIALVVLLLAGLVAFGAEPDCKARPSWCQPGYVCTPTWCAAEAAAQLYTLSAEVDFWKARRARWWNCTLGPGAGAFLQVHENAITLDAAPQVMGITCGWNLTR